MSTKQWRFEMGGATGEWPQVVCGDGPSDLIARTYGANDREHARLIAAAPDLYAALSTLLAWAAEHTDDEGRAEFQQAADALARARGEG